MNDILTLADDLYEALKKYREEHEEDSNAYWTITETLNNLGNLEKVIK